MSVCYGGRGEWYRMIQGVGLRVVREAVVNKAWSSSSSNVNGMKSRRESDGREWEGLMAAEEQGLYKIIANIQLI